MSMRVPGEKELNKLRKEIKALEVYKQYENHQPFLLSGLDDRQEYQSRIAYADTYCKELEELHEKLRRTYGLEKGAHEFDYLGLDSFRKAAGEKESFFSN